MILGKYWFWRLYIVVLEIGIFIDVVWVFGGFIFKFILYVVVLSKFFVVKVNIFFFGLFLYLFDEKFVMFILILNGIFFFLEL